MRHLGVMVRKHRKIDPQDDGFFFTIHKLHENQTC